MTKLARINIPVTFIEENDQVTAHCPVLDSATCGENFDEAKKRFAELVSIFFEELCEMGTVEDVLLECGWKKISKKTKDNRREIWPSIKTTTIHKEL